MSHSILFEQQAELAIITFNRPNDANGIDLEFAQSLAKVVSLCAEKTIRAVLIKANGRFFSAGGDLKSFAAAGEQMLPMIEQLITALHQAVFDLSQLPKPVIIAINGTAAGAGMSLACGGDFVFMSDKAKLTMAYAQAGLSPDGGSSYFLSQLVGKRKAQQLLMSDQVLTATDAYNLGIITEVINDEDLEEYATNYAVKLSKGPTQAFGRIKQLLAESNQNSLADQLTLESELMLASLASEDGKIGIEAFLAKEKPQFKGN